jgi:hypothetical protein
MIMNSKCSVISMQNSRKNKYALLKDVTTLAEQAKVIRLFWKQINHIFPFRSYSYSWIIILRCEYLSYTVVGLAIYISCKY